MRKQIISILILVSLLFSLPGCGREEVPPESPAENGTAQFLEDYDQLWRDLEENYPFFPILEEKGIDVAAVRDSYRLYVQKTATLEQFMGVLDRMFGKLQSFAHLFLFHRYSYDMMLDGVAEVEGFEPWQAVLLDPVTAATYAGLPETGSSDVGDIPEVECRYFPELSAAYFRFPTMNPYAQERDETILADYLSQLPDVAHIILDITGNPGGSSLYWENVITAPFGGSWTGSFRVFYQDSPINRQYYGEKNLLPVEQTQLPPFAQQLGAKLYETVQWNTDYGDSRLEKGTEAKRWVLTDGGYSAAESFAAFCKLTGWATLVGKPTNGDGLGGNPLLLPLKNTGLLVYFTTAMAENPDGTLNAQQGILPDHVLLPKDDRTPLELCKDLIREAEE